MAVRHFPDQPPAFGATSMQAGHVRFRPCLVDEDQPFRGDLVLMALPLPPATRDISAVLFAGAWVFFKAEANVIKKMPDTVVTDLDTALLQFRQQFASGQVGLLLNASPYPWLFAGERERLLAAHWQAAGLPVAAWRLVQRITDEWLPDNAPPLWAGSCRRRRRRQRVRGDRENTELPSGLASIPALILNQTFSRAGIPGPSKKARR
jgi:hypothetical protein